MFPQVFGKYMLEREIAAGGMARVYLATLRGAGGFEKRLVVKQIRPELASDAGFVERFVKEAKTAVELSHPNIVPVYELGVEQGVYYIAMEHCDGRTLSDVLATTGPLDAEEGAYLGVEVCRALDYAHRRVQVIHSDVTPRNVLIDEEGAIRLIDFGIAAPVAERDASARAEVFGSPGHMPPEQLAGKALTPASDVFAVGVLLYEAFTGRPAFRRGSAKQSRAALAEPQPPIDSLAARLAPLAPIVSSAMHLDERERPVNAEALARPLREFLRRTDAGDVARRLGERVRAQRHKQRDASPWQVGEGMTGLLSSEKLKAGADPSATPRMGTPSSSTRTFATSRSLTQLTRRVDSEPPRPSPPSPPGQAASPATAGRGPRGLTGLRGLTLLVVVLLPLSAVALAAIFSRGSSGAPARVAAPRLVMSGPASASAAPQAPRELSSPLQSSSASVRNSKRASSLGREPARSWRRSDPSAQPLTPLVNEAASAELSLTALPGTRVTVGDREYATPVTGLQLPAGQYLVSFQNATWEGIVSTRIVLLPGKQSRVHADFTNEPPRVVVR